MPKDRKQRKRLQHISTRCVKNRKKWVPTTGIYTLLTVKCVGFHAEKWSMSSEHMNWMNKLYKRSRPDLYRINPYITGITSENSLCLYKGYLTGFFYTKTYSSVMSKLQRKFNYWFRKLEGRFRSLLLIFFIASIYFVLLYKRQNPGMTPLMVTRFIEQVTEWKPIVLKYTRVPIENISNYTIYAVMAGEDQKFLDHYGFDVDAIRNALESNIKSKSLKIWGSTITQQTAKNLFLRQDRSLFRKAIESYFTVLMELVRSKERILEVYLNIIEFGDGIYGIEQASQYYFNTSADKLTRSQSTLLAAILPNPRYYQDHLRSYLLAKRKRNISTGINKLKREKENKEFIEEIKSPQ